MKKQYDKIVRDNIPEIIKSDGRNCSFSIVSGKEKLDYLFKKGFEARAKAARLPHFKAFCCLCEMWHLSVPGQRQLD